MAGRLAVAAAAALVAFACVGIALEPLLTPVYTRTLVTAIGVPSASGLPEGEALDLAEQVRRFVIGRADTLPGTISAGRPGFDEASVSHLLDVRTVILRARLATLLLLAAGAGALFAWAARGRWGLVARALKAAAVTLAVGVTVAFAVALLSFEVLFTAFHGLFFAPGTWTFPYGSLIIELFPERFWVLTGAAWGALIVGLSGLLATGAAAADRMWRAHDSRAVKAACEE